MRKLTVKGYMYRIVLIDIFCSGHYGIRSISATLKQAGFDVKCIYAENVIQDTDQIPYEQSEAAYALIRELKPDVIGLTVVSSFSHYFICKMAREIKAFSDVPVILGGPHPSLSPEFVLENSEIDFICIGESEETAVEMCKALEAGNDPSDIPGVMSKKRLTYVRRDPPSNLDILPFQDIPTEGSYTIEKDGTVVEKDIIFKTTGYNTRASRGCPFRCSYCSNDALRSLYSRGTYCRRRSVDNVIEEIKSAVQINPRFDRIWFMDDTFPYVKAWVEEFSEKYAREVGVPFSIWLNPQMVKDENIALLKKAGLVGAVVGIQSACEKTRREVFLRAERNESVFKTDQILTKYGIIKAYDFIIDHPWESEDELREAFDMLSQMQRPYKLNIRSLFIMPKTVLAKRAEEEGIATEEETINRMAVDPKAASRTFQWVKGIPRYPDKKRRYWAFLIMMLEKEGIPLGFIKFLTNDKLANSVVFVNMAGFVYGAYKGYGGMLRCIRRFKRRILSTSSLCFFV